jgi:hypothetical protein|tara:strand:- start:2203 stop:3210 length:1008 start_codon:yes stop_codon:yes gene_type:complete
MIKNSKIFIVGSSRSGTTMMSRVLSNHSLIFSLKELHFFSQIYSNRKSDRVDYKTSVSVLAKLFSIQENGLFNNDVSIKFIKKSESLIDKDINYTYFELFSIFSKSILLENRKEIICDQTPNNNFYLKDILEKYPEAKIINMVRDSRDVLLSQKNKWKRKFLGAKKIPLTESIRSFFLYHPITTSFFWRSSLQHTDRFISNPNLLIVRFEDFLLTPKKICLDICSFLDIVFEEKMLKVPNIGSSSQEDNKEDLRIDSSKIYKWKSGGLNSAEIFISQFISNTYMKKHGYPKEKYLSPPLRVLFYLISFPIKFFFSLLFNVKRLSSVIDLLKNNIR